MAATRRAAEVSGELRIRTLGALVTGLRGSEAVLAMFTIR